MTEEITIESLNSINIKRLALNSDFGKLKFERSYPSFKGAQDIFKNLDDHDYSNNLTQQEIDNIDAKKEQFIQYLKRLQEFDIGQAQSQQIHDNLENEVIKFYENTVKDLRVIQLALKDITASKSEDKQELAKKQKMAAQAEKKYNELSEKMKKELNILIKQKKDIETEKEKIGTAHGEVATKVLAHHFAKQANDHQGSIPRWEKIRSTFYWSIIIIICLNIISYFCILIGGDILNKFSLRTDKIFTLEYGIIKLLLISFLSYGLSFASKNYNIEANLTIVNKHRKNVAQTLEDFLATNPGVDTKSQMIKKGTDAMFEHHQTGYITTTKQKDDGPVQAIINNILKQNKE